ncbi:hypothetical protein PsorP6_014611 [Peronosclerospora sorghi]|uniref:Uncharacterized protein n=1 Tax=Peronosclerospora sorghi TaxID=230839 RepID=A0ACC0VTF5_9STRA|nr:hypothetical protein PsorP6_014611 [Peronosclerospora sorghi]
MVNFLELLFLAVLLGVPCAIILLNSAVNLSLFVLHPALNAIAFLLCFPLSGNAVVKSWGCSYLNDEKRFWQRTLHIHALLACSWDSNVSHTQFTWMEIRLNPFYTKLIWIFKLPVRCFQAAVLFLQCIAVRGASLNWARICSSWLPARYPLRILC